jgi:hypothetical protein
MIDPFMLATSGVGPGFSTFNMATNGFGFEIEVIIQPQQAGGGGAPTIWVDDVPYEIIVRVKYKGKTWEQRRTISSLMARSLEKVMSSFRRVEITRMEIYANIKSIYKRVIEVVVNRK